MFHFIKARMNVLPYSGMCVVDVLNKVNNIFARMD
jgi:hypothetical protein